MPLFPSLHPLPSSFRLFSHYRRRCKTRAPCCDEVYDCWHCHDETKDSLDTDPLDQHVNSCHEVRKVICSLCGTEQDKTNFDFDDKDPELRTFIENKMAKAFGSWRSKLHGHFKKYNHDHEYARANPPSEKLFGKRTIDEWQWLCDELFTDEDYLKQSDANVANRNKKEFNHCGGSRPYQKHMEAAKKKGKKVTFVENWSTMHQHHNGQWVNEVAEQKGMQMLAELSKTKELADALEPASVDDIEVPISIQLDILKKGIGAAKGRGIKGLGYSPRKERASSSKRDQSSASSTDQTVVKLTTTVKKLMRHIKHIEAQLATVEGYTVHDSTNDDEEEDYEEDDDGVNMYRVEEMDEE